MATPAHRIHYSYAEYLALEETSNVKHEYFDGQIYAMAGGTPEHAALAATLIGLLFPSLRQSRCRAYDADLRIRIEATGLTTYPDITVVCGPRELDATDRLAVTNPTLIAEILSRTTEAYDRGDKFDHYKHLPALKQYVLVSQHERRVEVWTRGADGTWAVASAVDGEVAVLDAIDARLDVTELYEAAADPA
jgi:Uma2 family endonuclease